MPLPLQTLAEWPGLSDLGQVRYLLPGPTPESRCAEEAGGERPGPQSYPDARCQCRGIPGEGPPTGKGTQKVHPALPIFLHSCVVFTVWAIPRVFYMDRFLMLFL